MYSTPIIQSLCLLLATLLFRPAQAATSGTSRNRTVPLLITNKCAETIWPAIFTQNGTGPSSTGFALSSASTLNLSVQTDWNGRVWGRTNCTFDSKGTHGSCGTGDCGGNLTCTLTGAPSTLAEFNLQAYKNMSFYDISLVDGYNLPMAIQVTNNGSVVGMPSSNATNLSCVGSVEGFKPAGWNPYNSTGGGVGRDFLGTTLSNPLPFDSQVSAKQLSSWCPSDLHMIPPVSKNRPVFDPCLSACSQHHVAKYCCTGKKNSAKKCGPNYYSRSAKKICPDAYSYAFDDAASTFAVPAGAGFEVTFCPGGRSTMILKTLGKASGASRSALSWKVAGGAMAVVVAVAVLEAGFV